MRIPRSQDKVNNPQIKMRVPTHGCKLSILQQFVYFVTFKISTSLPFVNALLQS